MACTVEYKTYMQRLFCSDPLAFLSGEIAGRSDWDCFGCTFCRCQQSNEPWQDLIHKILEDLKDDRCNMMQHDATWCNVLQPLEESGPGASGFAPCAHGSPGETDSDAAAGGVGKSHLWFLELHSHAHPRVHIIPNFGSIQKIIVTQNVLNQRISDASFSSGFVISVGTSVKCSLHEPL